MNTQEAYERMRAHALTMTRRAGVPIDCGDVRCMYRSPHGPCLIGIFLTDEQAREADEADIHGGVLARNGILPFKDDAFAMSAQDCHDMMDDGHDFGQRLAAALDELAAQYRLEVVK